MWWMWLAEAALAGQIFVNGAPVDPEDLAGTTLEQVEIRFDENGDVHIDAAGLAAPATTDVVEPADPTPVDDVPTPAPGDPATAPEQPAAPDEPAGSPDAPVADPVAGEAEAAEGAEPTPRPGESAAPEGAGSPWPPEPSAGSVPLSRITARGLHPSGVPEARWWLVVEDDGSRGHTVEILINDQLVATLRSGEVPRILDVGAHLVPGGNRVLLRATSTQASGGPLYVYLGSGSDRDGTVMLDEPEVQFALGASRSGTYQREYMVTVD